jgi:AcrR family transcriptional regulator
MTAQVAEIAAELFVARGYEATTIDDICTAAGISRSSFFRYFHSKEDVLLHEVTDVGAGLLAALQERPEEERLWLSLHGALRPLIGRYSEDSERAMRLSRLVRTTPSLATFHQEKLARWAQMLVPEVARRLGADPADPSDPRAAALVAAAVACLNAAVAAWGAADGAAPLETYLDRAMGAVG